MFAVFASSTDNFVSDEIMVTKYFGIEFQKDRFLEHRLLKHHNSTFNIFEQELLRKVHLKPGCEDKWTNLAEFKKRTHVSETDVEPCNFEHQI